MPRSVDRAPSVILPAGRPGAIPQATQPELKYEKGQTRAVNMWQWTRSVCSPIQATCPRVATEPDGLRAAARAADTTASRPESAI
jgi:hypothetical protein